MTDISILRKINRRFRMLGQMPFLLKYQKLKTIWTIKPYTMIEYPRLASAYDIIFEVEKYNKIEGAIVECGSWNGGYAALMNAVSEQCGRKRNVWLFDSFEGLPRPGEQDVTVLGKKGQMGAAKADVRLVEKIFSNLEKNRLHIVSGWFQDTFPKIIPEMGNIAYLHLDCDFYESTRYCLEQLFPQLSSKAVVIIDDYSYYLGCKKAVDEFLANKGISSSLVMTVDHSAYFRKP